MLCVNGGGQAIQKAKEVYNGSLENVDIWAGGMLETTPDGPGPLFQRIIRNQFRRIRAADRFWFENYKQNRCDRRHRIDNWVRRQRYLLIA